MALSVQNIVDCSGKAESSHHIYMQLIMLISVPQFRTGTMAVRVGTCMILTCTFWLTKA